MGKLLDRKLAKAAVQAELDAGEKIVEANIVLTGDESWNCERIYSEGKWRRQREFKCYPYSYWATPAVRIKYADGKIKYVDCYISVEEDDKRVERAMASL